MPSILIKSSRFNAAGGIVLTGEDVQEAANGLVTATLNYTIEPSRLEKFNFTLDAQPPIYPRGYSRSRLHNNLLFMVDRSLAYENGLVQVQAQYAGALNVPRAKQFITQEDETLTYSFSVVSGFAESTTGSGLVEVQDSYVISYRRRIITYEIATLDGLANSQPNAPDPRNLIISARYVSRKFAQTTQRTFHPFSSAYRMLLSQAELTTSIEENTTFVTPTVRVYTVSFIPEALSPSQS